MRIHLKRTSLILIAFAVLFGSDVCLSQENKTDEPAPGKINGEKDRWRELLTRNPYPHTIPLLVRGTILDGTYVKKAKKEGNIVPCRRCPDWLPNPGIWKLNLDKGTYRVYHEATGWTSIGSYILADKCIIFANDPSCIKGVGVYQWKYDKRGLIFKVVDDDCAIMLRAKNLTEVPWRSCQPPNIEAAVTEHWLKPQGCD